MRTPRCSVGQHNRIRLNSGSFDPGGKLDEHAKSQIPFMFKFASKWVDWRVDANFAKSIHMSTPITLSTHFGLMKQYGDAFDSYRARGVDQTLDATDKEWPGDETWRIDHYIHVGADALRMMVAALVAFGRPPPQRILDFPSGSGRVTRHLKAFFPLADIWACDLYESHIDFCARQFAAKPVKSHEDLRKLNFEGTFDLIFCGSLLTHLPEEGARAALDAIARALSPNGIAVVTVQGRYAEYVQKYKWKYLEDNLFAVAESQVHKGGFGFVDYRGEFRSRFSRQARYGIALVRASWIMKHLEAKPELRILSYTERGWDDHQDVLVFGKPGIDVE